MQFLGRIFFLLVAVLVVYLPTAEAYDFGCQYIWDGPNTTNDAAECLKSFYYENKILILPPLIPIIFFVLLLVLFPITFFCRLCCGLCGSNLQRPGYGLMGGGSEWDSVPVEVKKEVYPKCYVRCIKIAGLIVVILAGVSLILIPVGASKMIANYHYVVDKVDEDVLQWANNSINNIKNKTRTDDDPNRTYVAPLQDDTFELPEKFIGNWTTSLHDTDDTVGPYLKSIAIASYVLAAFPVILLLFIPVFILCNIRRCLPMCCTCVYFLVALIFSLLCTLVVMIALVFTLFCGEVTLQEQMSPGVFQWYLVPTCIKESKFNELSNELDEGQKEAALEACTQLRKVCDGNDSLGEKPTFTFNGVSTVKAEKENFKKEMEEWGQHQFYCPRISGDDYKDKCKTVRFVNGAFTNATAKEGSPLCDKCRMSECPEKCNDEHNETIGYTLPGSAPGSETITLNFTQAKVATRIARKQLADGEKLISALRVTFDKVNCDSLITQFLKPLNKCYDIREGALLIAAGFGNAAFWLAQGIMIMFKGQKVFI